MKLRVTLSVFLALTFSLSFFSGTAYATISAPQSGNIQNVPIGVSKYDLTTHSWTSETQIIKMDSSLTEESSPGYFPNGALDESKASKQPNGVIGSNNIVAVSDPTVGPYCNTVSLQITTPSGGTDVGSGFMIGPYAVATAAHCLTGASSIKVAPARFGDTYPFGQETVTASAFIISSSYLQGNSADDWGIIILSQPLGNVTGWFGLHWQSASMNGASIQSIGYPTSYKGVGTHYTMYKSSGSIRDSSTDYLKGDWDMTGGFSGGPLVEYDSTYGYIAVGINKDGNYSQYDGSPYPTAYSGAVRITQKIYDTFMIYR